MSDFNVAQQNKYLFHSGTYVVLLKSRTSKNIRQELSVQVSCFAITFQITSVEDLKSAWNALATLSVMPFKA